MKNIKKIVVISGVVVIMFCGYGVTTEVTDTKKENKNLINKLKTVKLQIIILRKLLQKFLKKFP